MELSEKEEKWLKKAAISSREKIEDSSIFLSLFTKNYRDDPLCALQLGIAIMLGKPIAILAPEGAEIPDTLARLADSVQVYNSKEGPKGIQDAVARVVVDMGLTSKQ